MSEELKISHYFTTPMYSSDIPEWVDPLNKVSDPLYLKCSKNA